MPAIIFLYYMLMQKNNTTQKIRTTRKAIITEVAKYGQQSIRKIASAIKSSKSSIHRQIKAQKERNQHPESYLWETEAGNDWMRLFFYDNLSFRI